MVMSAYDLDLTSACALALDMANAARAPVSIQWGAVTFVARPGDGLDAVHRTFFRAAGAERLRSTPTREKAL